MTTPPVRGWREPASAQRQLQRASDFLPPRMKTQEGTLDPPEGGRQQLAEGAATGSRASPCIVPATPPEGGGTREGGVRVPYSIPLPVRRGARSARARGAGIRRREDHGQAVRPPRRRAGRDHDRVLDEQPAAERAGRCGQPDAAEQDDGRRKRLLHGADERRRVGRLLLQLRRRRELDEQPAAGIPAGHDRRGQASPLFGLALGAGDPVQAWDRFGNVYYGGIAFNRAQAGERLDLGRALQLGRGRRARLPGYGARLARDAEPDLPRALQRQGDDRGRPEHERRDVRQRLRLLGAVHGQRPEQRRLLLALDGRRPHLLEPDEALRLRARQPVLRHRCR